ncbi:hypothetical protein TARUN_174 [Trichoderma arundinaceum]|uniref:Uncharacterized protein n=1 Tax=Trichoderma arundinaceum TaxID=490622 RepID=A0A395P156_TRIAR|nr:hypothetical protein TARUN_174 [Trichoderma arundinaceum]
MSWLDDGRAFNASPRRRLCLDQTLQSDQRRGLLASRWVIWAVCGGGEWEKVVVGSSRRRRKGDLGERRKNGGVRTHLQQLGAPGDTSADTTGYRRAAAAIHAMLMYTEHNMVSYKYRDLLGRQVWPSIAACAELVGPRR